MKLLDAIEMWDTGKKVVPLRPLKLTIIKEVESIPVSMAWEMDHIYRHELRVGCHTHISVLNRDDPNYMQHNEQKVQRMFAETIYGEVVDELHDILVYSYENLGDRELEDKIGDLIRKLRP